MKAKLGNSPIADYIIPTFSVGCRRPTPGVGYLEALTKDNVQVVRDNIESIVPEGIVLTTGEKIEIDTTEFDLSFCSKFPIIGRNGENLAEQWKDRPTAYLSMAPENIPNYSSKLEIPYWNHCADGNLECSWDQTLLSVTDQHYPLLNMSVNTFLR
jgi:cation diffusion facilitator CzcD-associated flavoprotein CzcO